MDIAALATSLNQAEVSSKVATSVARKALDIQSEQGDAAVALLKAAAKIQQQASETATTAISNAFGGSLDVNG
jgi:RecA/RadA recombinase